MVSNSILNDMDQPEVFPLSIGGSAWSILRLVLDGRYLQLSLCMLSGELGAFVPSRYNAGSFWPIYFWVGSGMVCRCGKQAVQGQISTEARSTLRSLIMWKCHGWAMIQAMGNKWCWKKENMHQQTPKSWGKPSPEQFRHHRKRLIVCEEGRNFVRTN